MNQQQSPRHIGLMPFVSSFFRFVFIPIAVIAMIIMNLPIFTSAPENAAGIGRSVLRIAVATKPRTNHGKTLTKLKPPSCAESSPSAGP